MSTTDVNSERIRQSAHISLVFEAAVKRIFGSHSVEMTRPEGGARAMLYIHLVVDSASYALGWANPAEGTAELHTLGYTLALSKRRRGRELVLRPVDYTRFLETAMRVLEDFGMKVSLIAYTRSDSVTVEVAGEVFIDEIDDSNSDSDPPRTPTIPYLGLHRPDSPSESERSMPSASSSRSGSEDGRESTSDRCDPAQRSVAG